MLTQNLHVDGGATMTRRRRLQLHHLPDVPLSASIPILTLHFAMAVAKDIATPHYTGWVDWVVSRKSIRCTLGPMDLGLRQGPGFLFDGRVHGLMDPRTHG